MNQRVPLGPPKLRLARWPLVLASMPLLLFLTLPLVALVLRTTPLELLRHLLEPAVAEAISLSLWTTCISLGATLIFGTPLAYVLARYRFRGWVLIDTLVDLPMVLPPAVAGIALLVAFGRQGLVGRYLELWGVQIAFTPLAVIMAQIFVSAPYYVKSATTGFGQLDREIEQAAAIDGAAGWRMFRLITLPLTWPALLGGAVMTWARALGEFGATIIFAGNFPGRTQTMPLAIYLGFELDFSIALTLAVVLLGLSCGVLLLVKWGLHRRLAALS